MPGVRTDATIIVLDPPPAKTMLSLGVGFLAGVCVSVWTAVALMLYVQHVVSAQ